MQRAPSVVEGSSERGARLGISSEPPREVQLLSCRVGGWLVFGCAAALASCYGYAYQERSMAPPRAPVAIDAQQIQTHTEWSYFWGLRQSEWSPDPTGCDGKGA